MKRKLLFLTIILMSYMAFAQFEVKRETSGTIINDGDVISFAESGCSFGDPCNMKFSVTNNSSEAIYMRIFVDELEGTDGSNFQLCFAGVCLNNVSLNAGYPANPAMIASGATNVAGNSFWNQNASSTTAPMSWTFRFQSFDVAGNEIGTPLTMTYNFDVNLSIDDAELNTVAVFPMVVKNELNVTTTSHLSAVIYDLLGKKIKQFSLEAGVNVINVSGLSSQPYIVLFTDDEGRQTTKKIMKN